MNVVKIREFFELQSNTALSIDRKAQILSWINTKVAKLDRPIILWARNARYFKTMTTAALAFVLMYVLYIPTSLPQIRTQDGAIVARNIGVNTVQAWYVWDILSTQGQIMIVRNGETTTTSQLQWWDNIYLYNTSKADFVLRDGSRGSVEWPAQITIVEQWESGLILTVDHARYIQIDKNDWDLAISQDVTDEALTIQTNTSRITTDKKSKIHLALVTTQDRQFIQNKGDEVKIESIVPDTAGPISKQLANSHVAELTDSVKVYTQVALVYDELKTKSISQTYDLTSDEVAIDDVRWLLALEVKSTPSNTIAFVNNTINSPSWSVYDIDTTTETTTKSDVTAINANDINDTYKDTLDTAVNNKDPNIVARVVMSDQPINTTFSRNSKPNSPIQDLSDEDTDNVLGILDDTFTESWISNDDIDAELPTIKPLTTAQIKLLISISNQCVTNEQLISLQQWFNITTSTNIKDTIAYIIQNRYLDIQLSTKLTVLTICDNVQN